MGLKTVQDVIEKLRGVETRVVLDNAVEFVIWRELLKRAQDQIMQLKQLESMIDEGVSLQRTSEVW